jgi:hypothetical protein
MNNVDKELIERLRNRDDIKPEDLKNDNTIKKENSYLNLKDLSGSKKTIDGLIKKNLKKKKKIKKLKKEINKLNMLITSKDAEIDNLNLRLKLK